MANRGRNINMYLMSGDVTGIIKCTFANWNGVVYKIPKAELKSPKLAERKDLKQGGIYFLIGKTEDTDTNCVYIGQGNKRKNGEGVLYRVCEHMSDKHKDYFNDVVILASQTANYGATEISYLENQFTMLAKEIDRYEVRNGNEPNPGNVTEEKISDLEEVVDNTKILMGALGYRIFVPMTTPPQEIQDIKESEQLALFMKRKIKSSNTIIEAKCIRTNEGFVVLSGSMIEPSEGQGLTKSLKKLRDELVEKNVIDNGILKKNQLFDTPSGAAVFVLGRSANGKAEWKDIKGEILGER